MRKQAYRDYVSQDHITSNKLPATHPTFLKPSFPLDHSAWPMPLRFSTFLWAVLFPNCILVFFIPVVSIQGLAGIVTVLSEHTVGAGWMLAG